MKPSGFHILVKPDPAKDAFKSETIAIPDAVLEKQRLEVTTGTLIGIGAQAWIGLGNSEPWAKVGDHIIYSKYGGKLMEDPVSGETLVLLHDKDLLGLVD